MFAKSLSIAKTDIDRAFDRHEFDIVLQPQIDVATGDPVAAEAFVRWNHPEIGSVTPQFFLSQIEAQGESPRLLDAVVRRSLSAAAGLIAAGHDWRVSINLGGADLRTGIAPAVIESALNATGLGAHCLVVEAPEAALVDGDELTLETLVRLREMGCGVALDSGGGMPTEEAERTPDLFTEIKIGGAAIIRFAEIARKVDGGRIARRLDFARRHGLPAVAVGVESQQTLNALVKLGFTAVQGALVMKPAPLEALLAWDGEWSGEAPAPAPRAPVVRPRPRLVVPPPPPVVADAPAVEKLVERLSPAPAKGFSFDDVEDDAMDVDFDDEAFGAPPVAEEPEADPAEDLLLDGEEMHAMESAAPLHAGMIERPRKRVSRPIVTEPEPPMPEPVAEPPVEFDRPLALRVKAPPPRPTLMQKLGLDRLFGR